jgi:hypothetical protein
LNFFAVFFAKNAKIARITSFEFFFRAKPRYAYFTPFVAQDQAKNSLVATHVFSRRYGAGRTRGARRSPDKKT